MFDCTNDHKCLAVQVSVLQLSGCSIIPYPIVHSRGVGRNRAVVCLLVSRWAFFLSLWLFILEKITLTCTPGGLSKYSYNLWWYIRCRGKEMCIRGSFNYLPYLLAIHICTNINQKIFFLVIFFYVYIKTITVAVLLMVLSLYCFLGWLQRDRKIISSFPPLPTFFKCLLYKCPVVQQLSNCTNVLFFQ